MLNANSYQVKNRGLFSILVTAILCLSANYAASSPPAFPEAEGGGAAAVGGRGGTIYEVTNLNDSGIGSLRYGLQTVTGPRIIVFRVGGYIDLLSSITVSNESHITIAGQTAPGDGITIRGENLLQTPLVFSDSHDLIIRYLRIRKGGIELPGQVGDCISFTGTCYDVMVDHCSVSWSHDENLSIWSDDQNPSRNITVQWTINSEGLNYANHATGLLAGSNVNANDMHDLSIHHNFFAHQRNRSPLLKVGSGDITNNLIYNWQWWSTGIGGGIVADIVSNHYKAAMTGTGGRREVLFKPHNGTQSSGPSGNPSIYFEGNTGPHSSDPTADAWDLMFEMTAVDSWGWPLVNGVPTLTNVPSSYRRLGQRALAFPITTHTSIDLETLLLAGGGVGASQRLDNNGNWVANRDSVDDRIIDEYNSGTGIFANSVSDVGGWPTLNGGVAYADLDSDGMPDAWEDAHGFDRDDESDSIGDADGDGYDNIEEFLNGSLPRLGAEYVYVNLNFDETSGTTANDASGNGIQGTLENTDFTSASASGRHDGGIRLDGVNDRLKLTTKYVNLGTGDFTLMAWVHLDVSQDCGVIEMRPTANMGDGRVRMGLTNEGKLEYGIYDGAGGWTSVSGPTLTGGWHHIAVTYDRDGLAVAYVDNIQVGTRSISSAAAAVVSGTTYIGYDGWTATKYFEGVLDDVKIYRRVLSPEEIFTASGDAEVYLKLDETSGLFANDSMVDGVQASLKNGLSFSSDSVLGYSGNALDFDGVNDRIQIGVSTLGQNDFSISARIKFFSNISAAHVRGIVSIDNSGSSVRVRLGVTSDGELRFGLYTGSSGWKEKTLTTNLADGMFHDVVVTYDRNGEAKAHVDGVFAGSVDISGVTGSVSGTIHVGYDKFGGPGYFNGVIDEVQIYDRVIR